VQGTGFKVWGMGSKLWAVLGKEHVAPVNQEDAWAYIRYRGGESGNSAHIREFGTPARHLLGCGEYWGRTASPPWIKRMRATSCSFGNSFPVSSSLLGPVLPSFRALSGRLKFTVRRHKSNKDSLPFLGVWGLMFETPE